MDLALTDEQRLLIETTRAFVERELFPHEEEVERTDRVRPELAQAIVAKAKALGLYAANMPAELGGGGLDNLTLALVEKELGRASFALQWLVARPSNILQACKGSQIEAYLRPTIAGDRFDCLAMTEPEAGSDIRSMRTTARPDGDDWLIDGTKHFISHADIADYVILFAASGEEATPRGPKKRVTAFLVDKGTPGFTVERGYRCVSHRGYHNAVLRFDTCRVPGRNVLGEPHKGFDVANEWLAATRISVAAMCLGRAERALSIASEWAATRRQFGRRIGEFQGVSFQLADMRVRLRAAELLTWEAAWKADQGTMSDADAAIAKLYATEMLAFVADSAIQILGGMGLMAELPLERIWRDARVERIWDGTSEIQRHIISRDILRGLGA
jgi:acyl-CoA dehydrogenase